MKDNEINNYVITFPLVTEKWQEDLLEKYFNHCCYLRNKLLELILPICQKYSDKIFEDDEKIKQLTIKKKNTKLSKEEQVELTSLIKKKKKTISDIKTDEVEGLSDYPKTCDLFSEFGLVSISNKLLKLNIGGVDEKNNQLKYNSTFPTISTKITNQIGKNLYKAFEKYFWGNGKMIHFKKQNKFNTISFCYSEDSKFILIDTVNYTVNFNSFRGFHKGKSMIIPFKINSNHEYEVNALNNQKIVMVTLKRTLIRGKMKYYLQLTFQGKPSTKGRTLGIGNIGIDPGVSHVTCYGKTVKQYSNADDVNDIENKIAILNRSLDRKRRVNNPNKYNEDGTIKKGNRDKWIKSKNYIKDLNKLHELQRKLSTKRKEQQIQFANELLSDGNVVKIEDNSINSWTKRKKETTIKNGKYQSKKRYGKSVSHSAPSQLLTIIKSKFNQLGGKVIEINQCDAKATGTDHTNDNMYTKIPVGTTKVTLSDGTLHHRDAHAAFNLKHWNDDKKQYDVDAMNNDYQHYCEEETNALEKHNLKFGKK